MTLVTGTPLGVINAQDDLYIDTPPSLWFQDATADLLNKPDSDGFHWGLTGTAALPVYEIDCTDTIVLTAQIDTNPIQCDTVGKKGDIQKITSIDLTFNLKTLLPFDTVSKVLRGGAVTTTSGATEKFGIGQPNNQQFWHLYGASVYDNVAGDYINFTGHRAQFVDSWALTFAFGAPASLAVVMRIFADDSKPSDQLFMTLVRADPSAIP